MIVKYVSIHDHIVGIESDSALLLELLMNELTGFEQVYDKSTAETAHICISQRNTLKIFLSNMVKVYSDKGGVTKYREKNGLSQTITTYADYYIIKTYEGKDDKWHIECNYKPDFKNYLDITSEIVYELAYKVLLDKGFYPLHAGGMINDNGKCILLCGNSFHGKTTLCIAALEHGFRILSDDMPLLKQEGLVNVFAFPRTLRICDDTIEHFSNCKKHIAYLDHEYLYLNENIAIPLDSVPIHIREKMRRGMKARVLIDDAYPHCICQNESAHCLIVLKRSEEFYYKPLEPLQAFNNILENNLAIYSFRSANKQIYYAFSTIIQKLVQQCQVFEMGLGPDLTVNCQRFIKAVNEL
ncbi:MAG: hypothetical protein HFE77_01370 [Clostridiales bacterium]|nr:hypothetical protein [Clostridiales bacterium]